MDRIDYQNKIVAIIEKANGDLEYEEFMLFLKRVEEMLRDYE